MLNLKLVTYMMFGYNYIKKSIGYLVIISMLSACDSTCPPNDFEKKALAKVEIDYGSYLSLKRIPCDYIYVDLYLKSESVDTALIRDVHKVLYQRKEGGWQSLVVHDNKGKFLFSHHYTGAISTNVDK